MVSEISYCGQLVREQDADRFLLSMFAPSSPLLLSGASTGFGRREALWALFAFNHEIAKTREVVSETQLGMIRLQWWRDAIAGIYGEGESREHGVVDALAAAIQAYDLPREPFDALIYAREFDLEDVLPGNLEGLVNYADFTGTPLLSLVARVLGAEDDPIQAIATNYALAGILRAVPFFAGQRRCLLPEDLMHTHGCHVNQLFELKREDGLARVVEAVAQAFVPGVRAQDKVLRRFQILSHIYMRQLARCGYDVFNPRLQSSPAFKELRLVLGV